MLFSQEFFVNVKAKALSGQWALGGKEVHWVNMGNLTPDAVFNPLTNGEKQYRHICFNTCKGRSSG
jgi:hypothetical protein